MHILRSIACIVTLGIGAASVTAAPAAYYQWRSKANGQLACSQTPLGEGWERAHGPYRDARCEKLIVVK